MASRVPIPHYHMRPSNSYMESSVHDLNNTVVDRRNDEIEGISDVDRDAVSGDSLEHEDESNSVDCMHETYRNSLSLHDPGVDEDHSALENTGNSPTPPYHILSVDDVLPIESSRARFLQFIVDNFISEHVIEGHDTPDVNYGHGHDKLNKRKSQVHYEGDPRFVLPLMYVANLYETLVNDANIRISSLDGIREKTIGVALEAAGGLYRKLAKKFPKKGPCSFKRRELATSVETRTRFPELVVHEEKRVRFVVVNGLDIIEKPSRMNMEDVEWFKRLTGRHEVAVSAADYKFYSPRHKYRRVASQSISTIPGLAAFSAIDTSSPLASPTRFRPVIEPQQQQPPSPKYHIQQLAQQAQFHNAHQTHHQCLQQNQHASHFPLMHPCTHLSHLQENSHAHQLPTMPQHMPCVQSLGSRLHSLLTTPAKFCDECGAPYLRETSKFCSECGTKRLHRLNMQGMFKLVLTRAGSRPRPNRHRPRATPLKWATPDKLKKNIKTPSRDSQLRASHMPCHP